MDKNSDSRAMGRQGKMAAHKGPTKHGARFTRGDKEQYKIK
jgi:hypothetical protein